MAWSLAADGFYDYTPSTSPRTKIYYVSESGDNSTATVDDKTLPWRTVLPTHTFTVSAANATRGAYYQQITSYIFTVSGVTVTPTAGATYTSNSITFTVTSASITGGDGTVTCTTTAGGLPTTAPSTLSKSGGTGDASLSYSEVSYTGDTFYVVDTISGGTSLLCTPNQQATPSSSGILTKRSGTGDATVTFSAVGSLVSGAVRACYIDAGNSLGSNTSNWILLRRGDTFERQSFEKLITDEIGLNGSSEQSPLLIGCYDPDIETTTAWGTFCTVNPANSALARPIVTSNPFAGHFGSVVCATSFQDSADRGGDNIVIVGLEYQSAGGDAFVSLAAPLTFGRVEDCKVDLTGGGGNGIKTSGHIYRCVVFANNNAGQGIEGHGSPISLYGAGTNLKIIDSYIDAVCGPDQGFVHNIYAGSDAGPTFGVDPGPCTMQNMILSRDALSFNRSGGIIDNTSHISNCAFSVGNTGDRLCEVKNNVWLEGRYETEGYAEAFQTMNYGWYISNAHNQGSILWDNNIISKDVGSSGSGGAIQALRGATDLTISNNILYKWGANNNQAINPSWIIQEPGNIARIGTITPGSGYTDKTADIVGITIRTANSYRIYVYITIDSSSLWDWKDGLHNREGYVYLDGITGDFSVLNGRVYRQYWEQSGTLTFDLQGDVKQYGITAGSTWSLDAGQGGGTRNGRVFIPYLQRLMTNGSGSNFAGDVLVANGQVVDIRFGTDCDDSATTFGAGTSRGSGFSNSDTVTLTGSGSNDRFGVSKGTIPGGSGFSFQPVIANITPATTTIGSPDGYGNVIDPTGAYIDAQSATYPDPNRTPATYYDLITGSGGHTTANFLDACHDQSRQTWDSLLTAESLNDYIREGFGKAMIGSAYKDQYGRRVSATPFAGSLRFRMRA